MRDRALAAVLARVLPALALGAGVTACGASSADAGGAPPAPPAATATSSLGTAKLSPSTYCWSSRNADGTGQAVCADGSPPTCETAPHLPAAPGEAVKVRLGFAPTAVEVTLGSGESRAAPAKRDLVIPLESFTGVATLLAHRGSDDVIYGICVERG